MSRRAQTQGFAQIRLAPLVQEAIRASPEPPRGVAWIRFAVRPYNREMAPRQLLIAVIFGAIFAVTFFAEDVNSAAAWVVRVIIAGGGLWILGVGFIAGLQVAWHTRRGLRATAEVADCERSPDAPLDVAGERVVHHPVLGDFRDDYLFGAPWAPTLRPGDRLDVLVHPTRRRTWFTFGLVKDAVR